MEGGLLAGSRAVSPTLVVVARRAKGEAKVLASLKMMLCQGGAVLTPLAASPVSSGARPLHRPIVIYPA